MGRDLQGRGDSALRTRFVPCLQTLLVFVKTLFVFICIFAEAIPVCQNQRGSFLAKHLYPTHTFSSSLSDSLCGSSFSRCFNQPFEESAAPGFLILELCTSTMSVTVLPVQSLLATRSYWLRTLPVCLPLQGWSTDCAQTHPAHNLSQLVSEPHIFFPPACSAQQHRGGGSR